MLLIPFSLPLTVRAIPSSSYRLHPGADTNASKVGLTRGGGSSAGGCSHLRRGLEVFLITPAAKVQVQLQGSTSRLVTSSDHRTRSLAPSQRKNPPKDAQSRQVKSQSGQVLLVLSPEPSRPTHCTVDLQNKVGPLHFGIINTFSPPSSHHLHLFV